MATISPMDIREIRYRNARLLIGSDGFRSGNLSLFFSNAQYTSASISLHDRVGVSVAVLDCIRI